MQENQALAWTQHYKTLVHSPSSAVYISTKPMSTQAKHNSQSTEQNWEWKRNQLSLDMISVVKRDYEAMQVICTIKVDS